MNRLANIISKPPRCVEWAGNQQRCSVPNDIALSPTANLLFGVAAVSTTQYDSLIAGVAGLVAGALVSTAAGGISVRPARNRILKRRISARERKELSENVKLVQEELAVIYALTRSRTVACATSCSGADG